MEKGSANSQQTRFKKGGRRTQDERVAVLGALLHTLDERGKDALERLFDDPEAVSVVPLEYIRTHEGEDGHDVVYELVGHERAELREEEERLV